MTLSAAVERLYRLTRTILAFVVADSTARASAAALWEPTFAWWPVWPDDERGMFWLEPLWQRRHPLTRRWQYRSWRSEAEKARESRDLTRLPLIH